MKLKNPKVSVIIPVYNGEKRLINCLNSVLQQTYKIYEVIIVDNNSNDKTIDIIYEFKKKYNNIISVFEPFRSRGAARNRGIQKARGEIIAMTDADCIVPRDWIEKLTKPIIEDNEDAVEGFEEDIIKNFWTRITQKNDWEFLQPLRKGKYINHIDTKNFAVKTSLMKKLMFNKKIGNFEDYELYLRLKKISKIRFLPHVRVGHYHKSSFLGVVFVQSNRGFWGKKIYDLHKKEKDILKELVFEQIPYGSIIRNLKYIYYLSLQNPNKEIFYRLIVEISWRAGILWAMFIRKVH